MKKRLLFLILALLLMFAGCKTEALIQESSPEETSTEMVTTEEETEEITTEEITTEESTTEEVTTEEPTTEAPTTAAPTTAAPTTAPPTTAAPVTPPANVTGGHIVAIDPGHQAQANYEKEPMGPGSTEMKTKVAAGATGVVTGLVESQLNLQVSLKLREELVRRGYQVVMIRETQEVNISNAERAAIANSSGAEIFLRIHGNSLDNQSVHGIVTMCPSPSNPFISHLYASSYALSSVVLDEMLKATGARNAGLLQVDNMSGINWSAIPVSIVELGFMSNPEEDVKLSTPGYQDLLVQGIANGVDRYFGY